MIEFARPWIRNPEQKWNPPNPEPINLYSPENIDASLEAMRTEATEIGLEKGVAYIAYWPFFSTNIRVTFTIVDELERDPDPNKQDDKGTNYFGIAMAKLAYSLSTHEASGSNSRPIKNGEVAYRGGLTITTEEGSAIFAGYSGGTENQDVQIARKGLSTLIELAERE